MSTPQISATSGYFVCRISGSFKIKAIFNIREQHMLYLPPLKVLKDGRDVFIRTSLPPLPWLCSEQLFCASSQYHTISHWKIYFAIRATYCPTPFSIESSADEIWLPCAQQTSVIGAPSLLRWHLTSCLLLIACATQISLLPWGCWRWRIVHSAQLKASGHKPAAWRTITFTEIDGQKLLEAGVQNHFVTGDLCDICNF